LKLSEKLFEVITEIIRKMATGGLFSMFINYINSSPSNPVPQMESKTRKKDNASHSSKQATTSKAQRLQNNHKMSAQEVGWFSVPEYSCPGQWYPQMEQTKHHCFSPSSSSSSSSTQPVYNITTNCYEDLPVYQDQHQVNPQFWMGEMEGHQFLDCVEILVREKSDQRLAAEILANSRLNPNAKEFTPKTVIEKPSETRDTIVLLDGHNELIVELDSLEDDPCLEQSEEAAKPNCSCDIIIHDEESGSDGFSTEEEEEEEDDDWWDSDEQSTGECVIIDPAEFEDLFAPSLLINNLSLSLSTCSHHNPPSEPPTTNPRLREANKRFLQIYPDVDEEENTEASSKTVQFSSDPTIILEPESLAEELQLARIGEFAARQADRERMERLIGPILTETHRQNIYQQIYGESLSNA